MGHRTLTIARIAEGLGVEIMELFDYSANNR